MGLSNPESVARIKYPEEYTREQPDLDKYAPAFVGTGVSSRFAGTDIDGLFGFVERMPMHGMWERHGFVLIQEHKKSDPISIPRENGQLRALSALAKIHEVKLRVIFTFGPAREPSRQSWRHLMPNGAFSIAQAFTDDPKKWPHHRWITWAQQLAKLARGPL